LINLTKTFQIIQKPYKNLTKPYQSLPNLTKAYQTLPNLTKPYQTLLTLTKTVVELNQTLPLLQTLKPHTNKALPKFNNT
jgi:hypothetical protein